MQRDQAETVALEALAWLAGSDELLPVFLGASGVGAEELRTRAAEPDFLAALLDFVLLDDDWVLAFAQETGRPPEQVAAARVALPGGDGPHWT
jgi:hypothetical protein